MSPMTDTPKQIFGRLLKDARERQGYSRKELAAVMGVSESAVGYWERGEDAPDLPKILRLEDLLEVPERRLARAIGHGDEPEQIDAKLDRIVNAVEWIKNWAEGQD